MYNIGTVLVYQDKLLQEKYLKRFISNSKFYQDKLNTALHRNALNTYYELYLKAKMERANHQTSLSESCKTFCE